MHRARQAHGVGKAFKGQQCTACTAHAWRAQVHLFDIDVPGKITFRESDTLSAGQAITVVDTEAGRLGVGICYDIRFPELAQLCARRGAQIIIYPGDPCSVLPHPPH